MDGSKSLRRKLADLPSAVGKRFGWNVEVIQDRVEQIGQRGAVGLVPAVQQLSSYRQPMVANYSDGFRCVGCLKESLLA
jgi:hypothetical protein